MSIILNLFTFIGFFTLSLSIQAATLAEERLHFPETIEKHVMLDKSKITHLVFIDLWRSYGGQGDEGLVAKLPQNFLNDSQQIWLQPEINVTQAQLSEFQKYFPKVTPLILDRGSRISQQFNVWQSPYHVLFKNNKQLFSGEKKALIRFITDKYPQDKVAINELNKLLDTPSAIVDKKVVKQPKNAKLKKPIPGDDAPHFSTQSMKGELITLSQTLKNLTLDKPLSIIFMDSLCPMPHYPGCQKKFVQLNELVKNNKDRLWLGVISSFYVNEDAARQFAKSFDLKIPLIFDQGNSIFKAYDIYATPYQVDVNSDGTIVVRTDQLH
ncbi:MAG: redoxin domain-containing protein [Colwellia sp.]|nr:redoxin domain-containing protein [Colwellia sp.]